MVGVVVFVLFVLTLPFELLKIKFTFDVSKSVGDIVLDEE